jgi:Flp pilus assembly protein TadB
VQTRQGGHAVELLRGLQESVRARVSLRTRIRAEQESPKWEIRLTTGFIFLTVVFARISNPAYGAFWRTPVGSISLFVAFALAVGGFFIANQVLASSARVEESFGTALPGQPEAVAPTDMPIAGRAA